MGARAASRLEYYGFERVYDYAGGKRDWLAYNLPREGIALIAGDAISAAASCRLGELIGAVRDRVGPAPGRPIFVIDEHDVVAGVIDEHALEAPPERTVDQLLIEGPSTVRPSDDLEGLLGRLEREGLELIGVTSPDGRLLGVVERATAVRVLGRGSGA